MNKSKQKRIAKTNRKLLEQHRRASEKFEREVERNRVLFLHPDQAADMRGRRSN